jgi:alcohol dehydrogenase
MKTRCAVLSEMGATPPFASSGPLRITELELDAPGEDELLVRIESAGGCHSDGVADVQPGDHVVLVFMPHCGQCANCRAGRTTLCGPGGAANRDGTLLGGGRRLHDSDGSSVNHHLGVSAFSEHAVVHRSSAVVIDKDIPFDTAAVFGCALLTGAGAVWNTAGVGRGDSVAVIGLGGVGMAAVLGAVVAGAGPIIAIDPLPAKQQLALALGATHAAAPQEAQALAAELTGGGVRWSIEAAGVVPAMEQAFALLGRGGSAVSVGLPAPDATITLPALAFVGEAKSFIGSYMGGCLPQRDIPRLAELWRSGALPVERLISGTIGLEDLNTAMDTLAQGAAVRQIVRPHGRSAQ